MSKRNRNIIDVPSLENRRQFMKWTVGLGAALGLEPWKVFEVNESIFGAAFAQEAACAPVNRFVGSIMGNGGFAWMTQLFPFTTQATLGGNRAFYATGRATDQLVQAGDHAMKLGPDAPNFGGRRVTGFVAGQNETHTNRAVTASRLGNGVGLFAAVSSLQSASPTLVPAVAVGDLPFGVAAGAPSLTSVGSPADMVGLFNSAASTAGNVLSNPANAQSFEALYKTNLSFRRAANRATMRRGHQAGKVASNLLGRNLADQLTPSDADLTRYGVSRNTPGKLQDIARTLITTAKSFRLNLTNSVLLSGMNDDPHGAFANRADLAETVRVLGGIWTAFMADLAASPDPTCAGKTIADSVVAAWVGDTGKDPNDFNAWPDGTPGNSNWMYVMGNGWLRSGWFGDMLPNGGIATWNPTTGANVQGGSSLAMAEPASAAVLYSVVRGDMRRVREFYAGAAIDGVVVPRLM